MTTSLTGLSFPTVSSVINALVESKEVLMADGNSNGGRPGAVFKLNPEYQYVLCVKLLDQEVHMVVYDACGFVCQKYKEMIDQEANPQTLISIFENVKSDYPALSIIVIGIAGVALNGLITHLPNLPKIEGTNLVDEIEHALQVKVQIENDINTIVIAERDRFQDLAHITAYGHCIGTGIMIQGNLIRGAHGCAGEMEFICDKRTDDISFLKSAILPIMCIIDVPNIAISGISLSKEQMEQLNEELVQVLPKARIPKIYSVPNDFELYDKGLWDIALEEYLKKE